MTRRKAIACCVLSVIGLAAAGGCYQRVVGARGYGSSEVDVYEPSVADDGRSGTRTPIQRKPPTRMTPRP